MGSGRTLGLFLAGWLEAGTPGLDNGVVLGNRLVDGLGADQSLAGPVRDLARRPLLQQALAGSGTARRAALAALVLDLQSTYAPAVLAELVELLEVGLGVGGLAPSEAGGASAAGPPWGSGPHRTGGPGAAAAGREAVSAPPLLPQEPAPAGRARSPLSFRSLGRELLPLGPGLALAAAMALVLAWFAGVLDREVLAPRNWSAGPVLPLLLGALQISTLAPPLRGLRRSALLDQEESAEPRLAWRWVSAPWFHRRNGEALVNGLLLLLILGPTPLGLDQVVLRYTLTALACLALAALAARRQGLGHQCWGGASGAVGALVGLAVGLSLLRWRVIGFMIGGITVPAWVLLVVVGSLQLAWILPRSHSEDGGRPGERLLASPWWWGLLLGLGWAGVSRASGLLQGWLGHRPG